MLLALFLLFRQSRLFKRFSCLYFNVILFLPFHFFYLRSLKFLLISIMVLTTIILIRVAVGTSAFACLSVDGIENVLLKNVNPDCLRAPDHLITHCATFAFVQQYSTDSEQCLNKRICGACLSGSVITTWIVIAIDNWCGSIRGNPVDARSHSANVFTCRCWWLQLHCGCNVKPSNPFPQTYFLTESTLSPNSCILHRLVSSVIASSVCRRSQILLITSHLPTVSGSATGTHKAIDPLARYLTFQFGPTLYPYRTL